MIYKFLIYFLVFFYFINCKKVNTNKKQEKINITAESSLRNVLPEIIEHFNYKHPKIKVNIEFKPEILCKQDIYNAKVDLVINYSPLNNLEKKKINEEFGYDFKNNLLAFDGLILISNNKNVINSLDKNEIKKLITKDLKNQEFLLDDLYQNATFYFLSKEFLLSKNILKQFNGIENFNKMIEKINKQNNIIGFTSSLNINAIKSFKNIKQLKIKSKKYNHYILLNKENIINQDYPFIRPIFYLLKHNYETPATWLVNFMLQEKGQLIFKRNCAIPIQKELEIRSINIIN